MNKAQRIQQAKQALDSIWDFDECSQAYEDMLIDVIPLLTMDGLDLIINRCQTIRAQMDYELKSD